MFGEIDYHISMSTMYRQCFFIMLKLRGISLIRIDIFKASHSTICLSSWRIYSDGVQEPQHGGIFVERPLMMTFIDVWPSFLSLGPGVNLSNLFPAYGDRLEVYLHLPQVMGTVTFMVPEYIPSFPTFHFFLNGDLF